MQCFIDLFNDYWILTHIIWSFRRFLGRNVKYYQNL